MMESVAVTVRTGETTTKLVDGMFTGYVKKNRFFIQCSNPDVVAIKLTTRIDTSSAMLRTCNVDWKVVTDIVEIPNAIPINTPVSPEEVKDIGALYGLNQVTKYMSMIKDVMENVKDDDIHEQLDLSYMRLDDDHKLAKTIDFAPRDGYYSDHLEWLQKTFMNTLDEYITGLLTILRDPNMEINIIGRPSIIRRITPVEYTYQTPSNLGPIDLDFKKTVVTSDHRVYNFISSDKLFGNDNLIVLLIPKNTNRIVYRLYDFMFYVSNEIRDAENPSLPALTAFQRYKFFELFACQGRIFVANPSGVREHLPNIDPIGRPENGELYNNNDLGSVYKHYDAKIGRNVVTENVLPEETDDGGSTGGNSGTGGNTGGNTGGTGTGG